MTRSMRVSVPRTSVSWVTRVSPSSMGVLFGTGRLAFGAWTALRLSPAPRLCILRGIACACERDARFGAALRAGLFAFAMLRLSPVPLCVPRGAEHSAHFDHEIVR